MNIIEQAAKRLEELRRAGAELPGNAQGANEARRADTPSTPEALVRALDARLNDHAGGHRSDQAAGHVNDRPNERQNEHANERQNEHANERQNEHANEHANERQNEHANEHANERQNERTNDHKRSAASFRIDVPPLQPQSSSVHSRSSPRRITIDLARLKARGFVSPDVPKSQIADEFRVIKRPIIRNALGKGGSKIKNANLVMVTSALPGEGKTFTAVNLALSVAMEYDSTVLLVDGDVAHPMLPEVLGVPESPGLLDLLTRDDLDVADALVKTDIDKLSILPAGSHHRRATELLASEQMASLLRELASRYADRIIIFDSPPLLPTTEARVLASQMGQIVMVVAADATTQNAVKHAVSTIENCEVVLMVLNKAMQTDVGTYYGYYNDGPAV